MPAIGYQIRVKGHLRPEWTEWFDDMTLVHETDGATTLSGPATFFSGWASSWLRDTLSGGTLQIIAIALAVIAGLGFIAAGLAIFDVLLPHDWWRALTITSSMVSLVLCALFWNTYLIVGPVVAIGIIVMLGFVHWPTEAALGY